jgi:hypothetical protein
MRLADEDVFRCNTYICPVLSPIGGLGIFPEEGSDDDDQRRQWGVHSGMY